MQAKNESCILQHHRAILIGKHKGSVVAGPQ
jgi:hypothetical protein